MARVKGENCGNGNGKWGNYYMCDFKGKCQEGIMLEFLACLGNQTWNEREPWIISAKFFKYYFGSLQI